jgi:hypothetical protein
MVTIATSHWLPSRHHPGALQCISTRTPAGRLRMTRSLSAPKSGALGRSIQATRKEQDTQTTTPWTLDEASPPTTGPTERRTSGNFGNLVSPISPPFAQASVA